MSTCIIAFYALYYQEMAYHEELFEGGLDSESLGQLFYKQILPYGLIPEVPVVPDVPLIIGRIVADTTIIFGESPVPKLRKHRLSLFNSLLFQRPLPNLEGEEFGLRPSEIGNFGYRTAVGEPYVASVFTRDMLGLMSSLSGAASEPVILPSGQRKGRNYRFASGFHVVDERLPQVQIDAQYERLETPLSKEQIDAEYERLRAEAAVRNRRFFPKAEPTARAARKAGQSVKKTGKPPKSVTLPRTWFSETPESTSPPSVSSRAKPRPRSSISSTQGLPKESPANVTPISEIPGAWQPAEQVNGRFVSMIESLTAAEIAEALGVDVDKVVQAIARTGLANKPADTIFHGTILRDIHAQIVGVPFGHVELLAGKLSDAERSNILRYLEDNDYTVFGDDKRMSPQAADLLSKNLMIARAYGGRNS